MYIDIYMFDYKNKYLKYKYKYLKLKGGALGKLWFDFGNFKEDEAYGRQEIELYGDYTLLISYENYTYDKSQRVGSNIYDPDFQFKIQIISSKDKKKLFLNEWNKYVEETYMTHAEINDFIDFINFLYWTNLNNEQKNDEIEIYTAIDESGNMLEPIKQKKERIRKMPKKAISTLFKPFSYFYK